MNKNLRNREETDMYIYNPIIKTSNNRNDYRQLTKDSHLVEDRQLVSYSHSVNDSQSVRDNQSYSHSVIYTQSEGSNDSVENNYQVIYSHLIEDNYLIERKEIPVIEGTGEILQDTSSTGRIRNWSEKKGMNLELVELLKEFRIEYPELLTLIRLIQIEDCATELRYGKLEEGKKKLVKANFCRFKLCPVCVWRKSLKLFGQVSAVTGILNKEYPSSRYIFATFTVKNVCAEELSDTIDKLNEGFKRLVQKNKTMAEAKVFQSRLLGYLKCLEITYNKKTHEYHPYIHAVFHLKSSYFGKNYISRNKWVKIWRSMMNLDYNPEVNIPRCEG